MTDQLSKLADGIFASVKGYFARGIEPIVKRVEAVERRAPERGQDGKSVDPAEVEAMVRRAVEALPKAKDGADGKDVDTAWLEQLISERVARLVDEAVKALPVPKDGKDGRDGKDGVDGVAGKGIDGRDGVDGRDAIQTIPLPVIDEERSYPRGTYAKHAGGRVVSFRSTTPGPVTEQNGWQVDCNGIAEVAVDLAADGRTVGVAMSMTDGNVMVKKLHFPVVLDKGVFNYEKEYAQGDNVTWGGSCWIAQKDGLIGVEPRGIETGWRLSTKKGQNGKDGVVVQVAPPATVKL